jgi:hypothetical protein
MIALLFISLMNLVLKKSIPRGLSSKGHKQQLHYIQSKQDDEITKSIIYENQKPLGATMHENGSFCANMPL